MYSRDEYCQTCHYRYRDELFKHCRHDPRTTSCDDCHVPTLAPDGKHYSIHDHLFDFSRPPMACVECHAPGEIKEGSAPPHKFPIAEVRNDRNMTVAEACRRCHPDKDDGWIRERMKTLRQRL